MNPIEKDPLQRKLEILNWIILGLFVLISLLFWTFPFTLGILLGGLISIVNFFWLKRDLRAVFSNLTGRAKSAIMFRYYLRFFVSAVIIFFIISRTIVDVMGLLIGLSIVVINIVLTLLMGLSKKNLVEEAR
ncbi:MAG: ATP synthase subunit I [Deltaproteobacteria bacterium]|nr:ATP synthase subunit I [Deltaproteobacteria bacterium]